MKRRAFVVLVALACGAFATSRAVVAGDAPAGPADASPVRLAFRARASVAGAPSDDLVSVVYVGDRPRAVGGPATTCLEHRRRPVSRALPDDGLVVRTALAPGLALTSVQESRTERGEPVTTRLDVVGGRLHQDARPAADGAAEFSATLPTIVGVGTLAGIALEFVRGRLPTPAAQVLELEPLRVRRVTLRLDPAVPGSARSVTVVEGETPVAVVRFASGPGPDADRVPRSIDLPGRASFEVDPASVLTDLADRPAVADTPERLLVALLDAHLRGDPSALADLVDVAELASRTARRFSMSAEAATRQAMAQVQRTLEGAPGSVEGGFEAVAFASWAASDAIVRALGDGRVEVDPRVGGVLVVERRGDRLRVADVVTPEECALDPRRPMWSPKLAAVRAVAAALFGDAELLRASLEDGVLPADERVPRPRWVKVLEGMRLDQETGLVERIAYAHRLLGGVTQENVEDPSELTLLDTITVRVRPLADGTWRVVDAFAR